MSDILLQSTIYHVDQMHEAKDWTIFKTVRTYRSGEMLPNTEITREREHIDNESYAWILCRMLNGVVTDVSKNIEVCGGLEVYLADGKTTIPIFECPKQCSVY